MGLLSMKRSTDDQNVRWEVANPWRAGCGESRTPGGRGGGETQFGCAPCSYLTLKVLVRRDAGCQEARLGSGLLVVSPHEAKADLREIPRFPRI